MKGGGVKGHSSIVCPACEAKAGEACKRVGYGEEHDYRWTAHRSRNRASEQEFSVRNSLIASLALQGSTFKALSESYSISRERVSQIVQRHCQRTNPLVYSVLANDNATRVYYSYVRAFPVPLNVLRENKKSFGV